MILIDIPIWAAHGTVFAHLVSDTSFEELHDFAARVGVPLGAFDGDHYDVPQRRYAACVASGATPVTGVELARRVNTSGLRLRKRKGEKGIHRWLGVPIGAGVIADIDLVASSLPTPDLRTGAAATIVRDRNQSFLLVHSTRRNSWDCPGGRRESAETVAECAARELAEETELVVDPAALVPCGYERIAVANLGHWAAARPLVQIFLTDLAGARPPVIPGDDVDAARWVSHDEFRELCRERFWWPLAAYLFDLGR